MFSSTTGDFMYLPTSERTHARVLRAARLTHPPHQPTNQPIQVPFLAVRGNHDYRTAPEAQIDYYEEHGEAGRWYMPAPGYYSVQKELADGTTVDLLFLDTVTLAPQAAEEKVLLPANVTEVKAQQYAWLEEELAASVARGADWRIVVGHYPVFSVGEHGDTPELMEELLPVLDKYGVDVYLSGHDHTMQHLQQRGSGVQFLINGSGSKLGSLGETTAASTVKAAQVYFGFMTHELTRDRLTTRALDSAGRTQYAFSQAPRSKQQGVKGEADAPAVHHAVPAKQQLVHKRGAASAAGADAAFEDGAPSSSSSSSPGGSRLRRHVAAATPPLALAGGLLALVVLMAVVWRAGRRRRGASRPAGQQRYHSVVNSSSSASGASAAAAASVGRGVWSDDELDEYDPDLDSVGPGEEFQVELPHLA